MRGSATTAEALDFERQATTLVARGHPTAAGLSGDEFLSRLEPLRAPAAQLAGTGFVLVVTSALVPAATAIGLVRRRGKAGILSLLEPDELSAFAPIEQVALPGGGAYLMTGVETGADSRGVTPDDALGALHEARRSPLTIDEGISLITQFPEAVATNGGFSLAGSRCGDRRVCALWISKGAPKLGWCWAGNPHSWLGTASCARRVGA